MKLRLILPILCLLLLCACGESDTTTATTEQNTETQTSQTQNAPLTTESETDTAVTESECLHAFGEWDTKTEATELKAGEEQRVCTRCGEIEVREIPPKENHIHNYTEVVYLPDCTEDGFTQKTCECGSSVTENIVKAPGHQYGDWTKILAPTTQQEGIESHTCAVCGATEKRAIEKLQLPPEFHVHIYTETVFEPTCTEDGYSLKTCFCGEYYTEKRNNTAGHRFGEKYRVLEPGLYCGLDRQDCEVCEEIRLTTVPLPPLSPAPPTGDNDIPGTDDETTDSSGALSTGGDSTEENDGQTPPDLPERTITYYSQRDSRWGNLVLGCGIMKNNGCGPTAIAIAMSYYGLDVTPPEVAKWMYENTIEFNHAFHGISGTGLRIGLEHYGREVVPIQSYALLYHHLKAGAVVVGCHGQGFFVSKPENSHCIVMIGADDNGKTYCYDPYTPSKNGLYDIVRLWEERSMLEVDLRQEGITHFAVY